MAALKYILIFVYLLITAALFITFEAQWDVWLSFFVSAVILTGITTYHVFWEKDYSPFLSAFIVFTFLFFLVAPIVQINSFTDARPRFETNFPYRPYLAVFANFLICIFNIAFFLFYLSFKKIPFLTKVPAVRNSSTRFLPLTIILITGISCMVFFASLNFVLDEIRRPNWMESDFSTAMLLLWKKVFFLIPFAGLILCFQYFKNNRKKAINLLVVLASFVLLFILLFWFKNPLTEKRNALGPIYICLLFLFFPKLLNNNIKMLFFLFFSMIVAFPMTAILTHADATFKEILQSPSIVFEQMKGGGISSAFNTLHYDAFSNIMATIDYVANAGYSYGYQLLSGLLFFVPRSLWEGKPLGTGELIGNYLISDYGFNFNNLSNPLVSEGYLNFGVFGVILLGVILALVIVKLRTWLYSGDYLKKIMALYFAIHLLFLLRGDFANGFSYYVGTFIGVLVLPKLMEYCLIAFFKAAKLWKKQKI